MITYPEKLTLAWIEGQIQTATAQRDELLAKANQAEGAIIGLQAVRLHLVTPPPPPPPEADLPHVNDVLRKMGVTPDAGPQPSAGADAQGVPG